MTPRFQEVPEHWKAPVGPYRQAPPEFGGEWWLVDPFTGETPWLTQAGGPPREILPEGYEEIFGPRPQAADFRGERNPSLMYRTAVVKWEQDLRYFKQAGTPEWADPRLVATAANLFEQWGMGTPRFYEGRYGWMARFPESEIRDYEASAWGALNASHLLVAQYQIRVVGRGAVPEKRHPFVPPHVWPGGEEEEVA